MYGNTVRNLVSMGDPVGNPDEFRKIVQDFYELAKDNGKNIAFYEISKNYLSNYLEIGLKIVKIGEEAIVNLNEYDLSSSRYKKIRYTFNKALPLPVPVFAVDQWRDGKPLVENT